MCLCVPVCVYFSVRYESKVNGCVLVCVSVSQGEKKKDRICICEVWVCVFRDMKVMRKFIGVSVSVCVCVWCGHIPLRHLQTRLTLL